MTNQLFPQFRKNSVFNFFINSRFASSIVLSVIVGITAGYCIVGFVKLIDFFQELFFVHGRTLLAFLHHYYVILIPVLGALIVGPIVVFISPEAKGHGVPEVMKAIALEGGRIRPLVVFTKAVASALAIGSGASVGREGPIVQVGSALGSSIGQLFRLNESRIKNLIACGAAAGISGVFNAPIAGVMFAMEVILRDFNARALSGVVIASVASSIISRMYLGVNPAFIVPAYSLWSPYELFLYFGLGIMAGFVALLYVKVLYKTEDLFEKWKFREWLKPAVGGLMLGILALFFPQVLGTGFETIEQVLHGNLELHLLAALVFVKIIATSVTLGSGNSGGVFAPGLFIGAVLGGTFGKILFNHLPIPMAPPGAYALVGMASVFAAAAHAPVTAILIVFEMTGDYKLILPLMVCTVVATIVAQAFKRESIYTEKLIRKGIDIEMFEETKVLGGLSVKDAMDQEFVLIPLNASIKVIAEEIGKNPGKCFLVTDMNGDLAGEIDLTQIEEALFDPALTAVLADDLMSSVRAVCFPEDSLSRAANLLLSSKLPYLIVVEESDERRIAGVLRRENVFKAYTRAAIHRDEFLLRMERQQLMSEPLHEKRFVVSSQSRIANKKVKEIELPEGIILVSVDRKGEKRFVPGGGTLLQKGDKIRAMVSVQNEEAFHTWLQLNGIKLVF